MEILLIIIGVAGFIGYILLYRSADKAEEKFANRATIITNPSKDLFINEKFAIVKVLAFIQGASPKSAFNDEANKIAQSTIFTLGLSQGEVEKILKISMNHSFEQEIQSIFCSLNEIRDRNYLYNLSQKCLNIAEISEDYETIKITEELFKKLGII